MKIVLVHGIFNTGHVLFWIKRGLKKCGFDCYTPSLWPFDGRGGIEKASQQLKEKIERRFGKEEKIVLIGYSMGGIVSRYYLQNLDGNKRVTQFYTIASPHNGSFWAYLPYPSKGVKQLKPNSPFLNLLNDDKNSLKNLQLYNYWTPLDLVVPMGSARWALATNKRIFSFFHFTIIFNNGLIRDIIAKIKASKLYNA